MTDETPEINSAEQEAEDILKEAFSKVDLDGEDCPQGDECAIHHRNDEEILDEEIEFGRLITYVGDYVIVTTDNPELENPIFLLKMILGQVKQENIPDLYETCVIRVGDGALADLRVLDTDARRETVRFVQKHNEWNNFKDAHNVVVNGVKEELIDVSKPAFPKED